MATLTFQLRGDQLGHFQLLSGVGNGPDRVVTLEGVTTFGGAGQIYTIVVDQVADGAGEFANGQFITILDAAGKVVVPRTSVQPDIEQGLGGGDEHLIVQGSNVVIDLAGLAPGPAVISYSAADETAQAGVGDNDGQLDFADMRTNFPCLASGALVDTPQGARDVADLAAGDRVMTADHGAQPVVWIGRRRFDLARGPDRRRPVLIAAGALDHGPAGPAPSAPLILSPQHRCLIRHAALAGPGGEVLVAAKALVGWPGIRLMTECRRVTYHAILLPRHAVIRANGCAVESFYPGRHVMATIDPASQAEVAACLAALPGADAAGYGPTARPVAPPGRFRRETSRGSSRTMAGERPGGATARARGEGHRSGRGLALTGAQQEAAPAGSRRG